jgi:LmbE family N-acetylglucosaminyl deacetylase
MNSSLPPWHAITSKERALIIAPHCDDETLACGGLIAELVRHKAHVHVVIMTNGDGFYSAAAKQCGDMIVSPSDYVEFGYTRQKESLRALQLLGVPGKNVTFFGYPDRGLAPMWQYNWLPNRLYRSGYTHGVHSPYANAYQRNAPHCGRSVLNDLEKVIREYKPTAVYYPHPSEQHTDHWASNCYVVQALYELGLLGKITSGMYIVHRGDWPVPQGLYPNLPLAPPASLKGMGTRWFRLDLDADVPHMKLTAIRAYKTQVAMMRRFMYSFDRANEIFSTYKPGTMNRVDHLTIGRSENVWANQPILILDPEGDGLNVDIGRNGDIVNIKCCLDADYLHVRVEFAHSCSGRLTYTVRVHGIPDATAHLVNVSLIKGRSTVGCPGASMVMHGKVVEAQIPLSALGEWNALMLSSDSSLHRYQVDRTAWRLLVPSPRS